MESGNESNDNSIISPIISEEEMDVMDSGDESDDEPMLKEILEDIRDWSQSHLDINKR